MIINILVFDGFDELDAVGPYEVFQNAVRFGVDCQVSLVTNQEQETVTAANGLQIVPDGVLPAVDDDDAPDLLVVPGGGWTAGDGGVRRELESGTITDAIRDHWTNGALVASVCTGAILLEGAGLLNDVPAVTHAAALEDLRDMGVEVLEHRIVDAGDIVTAGGVTSGIDLGLYLIGREFGDAISENIAEFLEYDREKDVINVQ